MPRLSAKIVWKGRIPIFMESVALRTALSAWLANMDRWKVALDVQIVQAASTRVQQVLLRMIYAQVAPKANIFQARDQNMKQHAISAGKVPIPAP